MTQKNLIVKSAVASCFAVMAGQSVAAVDLTSPTSVKFAKELPITSTTTLTLTNATNALDIRVPTVSGFNPTAANPLYLKINLANGAKFATAPTVHCSGLTGGSAAGTTTDYTGAITFGGVGQSTVTFTITANNSGVVGVMTGASGCVVSGANITVSGALSNVNASATFEYTNGAVPVVSGISGAFIEFVRGFSAVVSANTAVNLTVDAINGATRFTAGGPAITSASANLGMFRANGNGTGLSADGAATLSAADVMTATTVTVAGPAIAAALVNGSSGIYLSNAVGCAAVSKVASDSGSSLVTFNLTAADFTQLSAASGWTVCGNVSGNASTIQTGQLTATFGSGTGVANVTADLSAASNNLVNVNQNGAVMNAYFINASTSASKTSVLRVINNNSATATFRATAYDESGAVLGTASTSVGSAAANSMLTLTSAQIESALGFTPASATAKYRIVITGNVSSFKVVNFVRDNATANLTLGQQQDN